MKEQYIEIMDRALEAYDDKRILDYFEEVKTGGIREHGFARLTANMGLLITFGRRRDKLPLFLEMMDFCCEQLPHTRGAGNDFSIRELCFAILRMEECGTVPKERIAYWKALLCGFDPEVYYDVVSVDPNKSVHNWAAFNAASDWLRMKVCGVDSTDFVEKEIASQVIHFDENGMYKDPNNPMVYDFVGRMQLAVPLFFGYKGKYAAIIDENLKKAGPLSLAMQSVTGEMPFGGRSSQFIHNEAWIACCYEYEANRYAGLGDLQMALRFKRAAKLARENMLKWLSERAISHAKNRYHIDSGIGCEDYAYFNKYMITAASFAYMAYVFADDSICKEEDPDQVEEHAVYVAGTSRDFHKVFLRAGDYFVEYDTAADYHYDASGIGRIHKKGCPSALCLSLPFAKEPNYRTEFANPDNMSLCCFAELEKGTFYGANCTYELVETEIGNSEECDWAKAVLICKMGSEAGEIRETCLVREDVVKVRLEALSGSAANGRIGFMLPVLEFDGADETEIQEEPERISVKYRGACCTYDFEGTRKEQYTCYSNRSGRYRVYQVYTDQIEVRMWTIDKKEGE